MANDNDSVDSGGQSGELKPRRSSRARGGRAAAGETEGEEGVVVYNGVIYKVGDFVYYLDKKQDIYRIGLIEEFKHQKRDKLVNKRPEISVKQFYRLDEIPASVLSNQGEYDTHVMPTNFPEWLRQREIFISDNALSTSCSSLRSLCTVRHFPDLNHAMALFSTAQPSGQVTNSSPRVDHHTLINGKDNCCIPIPKQRDDNTFFYVYSYNARGRKLAATYLEIRVGPAYQAELPELRSLDDQATDSHYIPGIWEQLMWKPNQIPEEVFSVYNLATISIACFSGFGGGVDDSASVENGRKIASHMLTCQKALDCLHKSQYIMDKAMEIFAENSLPETNKMPFLWTDEDHLLFDESVKIHGKNFLRIKQDKRNKKGRLVGDYVTFYYYWKKNRPKNRKYTAKKNLRSRTNNVSLSEQTNNQDGGDLVKKEPTLSSSDLNNCDRHIDGETQSPSDASIECCSNCKVPLPKPEEEVSNESDKTLLSDRMKLLCTKCQHYLRRYGYQKPIEIVDKIKASDDDEDEVGDFEEGINGFDEEEDEEVDGEEDEEDELFQSTNSPHNIREADDTVNKLPNQSVNNPVLENKNTLAINKYDFDEEDENVEEVSSLLQRNHAKQNLLRESTDTKTPGYKVQNNVSGYIINKIPPSYSNTPSNSFNKSTILPSTTTSSTPTSKSLKQTDSQPKSIKRASLLKKSNMENCKKRKVDITEETTISRSSSVTSRKSPINTNVRKQIHESLKSNLSKTSGGLVKSLDLKKTEITSSQYDSNSSTSSSSSTSNDSSSSSDEGGIHSSVKRTAANLKLSTIKLETNKELKVDTSTKDSTDNSYNQMITSIPNIPGVCAVTNVGEPMPQLMQNLSTDLSANQPSSVSDLNITVAEPLYKQLLLRNPVTVISTTCSSAIPIEAVSSVNKVPPTVAAAQTELLSKFVNFNSISKPWIEGNPEETGLNLVKPKKRTDTGFTDHIWAPPHESPSKLVHHRGDNSLGDSPLVEPPKQMINDNEVIHDSMFGHIIRFVKIGDGCARTDLQHTTGSLKSADLEKKRAYINTFKMTELSTSNNAATTSQDSCKRQDDIKKLGTMPPPTDKNLVHHPSISKHFTIPPLTHSSSSINSNQSSNNQAHNRKINHGIRSPSPANSRAQSSFPSLSSNMIRPPSHIHNPNLHNLTNPVNNVRPNIHMNPNMQSVSNSPLLNDYNNMNKVNINELLFYQSLNQSYEELSKQHELQRLVMMYNLSMSSARPMQWDQRERFAGTGLDGWNGVMPGVLPMGPGGVPMDVQNILRVLGQNQPQSNSGHNRPRSATGLNLTNGGQNSNTGHGNDKPGSGRTSVNHDFQAHSSQMGSDNAEFLEMYQNIVNMQQKNPTGLHHPPPPTQNNPPPVAHALNNIAGVVNAFPGVGGGQHMGMSQNMLAQMQSSAKPPNPPSTFGGGGNCPTQQRNLNDILMYLGYNRNPPR